jgi:hypothetical protein
LEVLAHVANELRDRSAKNGASRILAQHLPLVNKSNGWNMFIMIDAAGIPGRQWMADKAPWTVQMFGF